MSKRGRLYRGEVLDSVREQLPGVKLEQNLYVEVILYPPDRRERDLDNYMKALLDSLTETGLWVSDKQIDQLDVRRGEVLKGGIVALEICDAGPVMPLPQWARLNEVI